MQKAAAANGLAAASVEAGPKSGGGRARTVSTAEPHRVFLAAAARGSFQPLAYPPNVPTTGIILSALRVPAGAGSNSSPSGAPVSHAAACSGLSTTT